MTTLANLVGKTPTGRNLPRARQRHSQRGVVLIIALVMLVIISLLAVSSMRNSGSTEEVLGNVRTTELATQAAEIALRRCEGLALGGGIPPATTPGQWRNLSTWDSTSTATIVLSLNEVNQPGLSSSYQRPPECMAEAMPVMLTNLPVTSTGITGTVTYTGTGMSNTQTFVITARGFGPEVAAANASRSRPSGSEVWLQSYIELTGGTITGGGGGGGGGGDDGGGSDGGGSHPAHPTSVVGDN
ncbi:MAG: hypothetical protein HHJ16_02835 [Polaromonas sp.]|uniref:pilus assembly PilX family protein n=1 Tax=Polaromonas sp. TaxID=1869339 RepID=UPI00179CA111|nr:PilX N-terminal domain-containing pilus assembly protein [Polaromonas sp.]NMM09193.1 hypothetical protein [Polaromonas sp.]